MNIRRYVKKGLLILFIIAAVNMLFYSRAQKQSISTDDFWQERVYLSHTEDPDQQPKWEDSITEQGITYYLEEIRYEILDKVIRPAESENIRIETSPPFTGRETDHEPASTIEAEGRTWYLKSYEILDTIMDAREQPVSDIIQYRSIPADAEVPKAAVLSVADSVTGREEKVQVPLKSADYGEERWESGFEFPITITGYEAGFFDLDGKKISLDRESPLRGYEEELLNMLDLPEENYRITGIEWDGSPYFDNGRLCRQLKAVGDWKVRDCKATYSGVANLPEAKAKRVQAVYSDIPAEDSDETYVYTMKAAARYSNTLKQGKSHIFWYVLTVVCFLLAAGCLMILGCKWQADRKGEEEYERLREYVGNGDLQIRSGKDDLEETYMDGGLPDVDEAALKAVNPEYAAWLMIPGTGIHYPVVWPRDNREYLKKTFEGKKRACGALFFEASRSPFGGFNAVIYGHNMKSGAMFGSLKEYLDPDYCKRHRNLYIFREGRWECYEVFAVYRTEQNDISPYRDEFPSSKAVTEFAHECRNRSLYDLGALAETPGEILTLSTCYGTSEKLVVHGRLV